MYVLQYKRKNQKQKTNLISGLDDEDVAVEDVDGSCCKLDEEFEDMEVLLLSETFKLFLLESLLLLCFGDWCADDGGWKDLLWNGMRTARLLALSKRELFPLVEPDVIDAEDESEEDR